MTFDYLLTKLPELSSYQLNDYIDGAKLWSSFAKKIDVPEPLMEQIAMELNSSITNQSKLHGICYRRYRRYKLLFKLDFIHRIHIRAPTIFAIFQLAIRRMGTVCI